MGSVRVCFDNVSVNISLSGGTSKSAAKGSVTCCCFSLSVLALYFGFQRTTTTAAVIMVVY